MGILVLESGDSLAAYSADLMEKSRRLRAQIVQAFTYPAIVVLLAFGIGFFLAMLAATRSAV